MKKIYLFVCLLLVSNGINAQNNFTEVYDLFQTKCAGCHNANSPAAGLNLSGTESEVYQALMNATVQNTAANEAGYEMVKPGYVRESFLFRKINNALDEGAMLNGDEGTLMPTYGTPLENYEMELVRQWIAGGAKEDDNSFDYDLIKEYYQEGGISNIKTLEPPAEGEGFQVYIEPVFLEPGGETELYNTFQFDLPDDVEVVGLEANIDEFSHHFIMYKFDDDANVEIPQGRRYLSSSLLENLNTIFDIFINAVPVGIWQYDLKHDLPDGTAYFWDKNALFDMNYHVKNYSQSQILAAQVVLNVYTQPIGTSDIEMFAGLTSFGETNPFGLSIPNNGQDTTYVMEMYNNSANADTAYFWLLQSHTHQLGIDFDMYLRNEDGSLGEQIYEGMRDPEHINDIGFYDYAHPPVLTYDDELLAVPMNQGITHIATYNNSGDAPVNFGLTTEDEMFITYFHYTREQLPQTNTSNDDLIDLATTNFVVSPNPFVEHTNIFYHLEKSASVLIRVFDVSGKLMTTHNLGKQAQGEHNFDINAAWEAGVYFVQLTIDGESQTKEVMKVK